MERAWKSGKKESSGVIQIDVEAAPEREERQQRRRRTLLARGYATEGATEGAREGGREGASSASWSVASLTRCCDGIALLSHTNMMSSARGGVSVSN